MRGQETAHSTFEFDDRNGEDEDDVGGIGGGNLNGLELKGLTHKHKRGNLWTRLRGVINLTVAHSSSSNFRLM